MNGGVSGKEKAIRTAFDFKDPCSEWRQTFESNAQTPLQYSDDSCTSDNSNNHRSGDSDSEEGDGHDSGISSDNEDDRTTYTAVQLTNNSLNSQKYTGKTCDTTNGGLLDESDNQQVSEDTKIISDCNPDTKGDEGYDLGISSNDGDDQTTDSEDDNPFLKDSLFMKLKIPLTKDEEDLIKECCKEVGNIEVGDITKQNKQEPVEKILKSIEHTVAKYLKKGVMLNLQCACKKTITNTVFERIQDLTSGSHMSNRSNTFVFDNSPCQSEDQNCDKENGVSAEDIIKSIVSNLLLKSGKVKRPNFFDGNEFEQIVTDNGFDYDLSEKCKKIESKLKDLAYESIANKSKQTQGVLGVDKDNGYFCIEYSRDSIVEVAKILNNEEAKGLNLRVGILRIGESIVRVDSVVEIGGKRNYTDVSEGGIEMSFTVEVREISIYLCPSKVDDNKIEVKIDKENRARLNELKDKGKSLGENCFLEGESVEKAIEHGSFEKYGSVPSTAMEKARLDPLCNRAMGVIRG